MVQDGFGPPADYNVANLDGALGGNPAASLFLKGMATPPAANEAGWKDTVGGANLAYVFEPDGGHGYVWHCHIIDHEDNEMMRPYTVISNPAASRSYLRGIDY